jgi:hypothetical protein
MIFFTSHKNKLVGTYVKKMPTQLVSPPDGCWVELVGLPGEAFVGAVQQDVRVALGFEVFDSNYIRGRTSDFGTE